MSTLELQPPSHPLAIRPESITTEELTLSVHNRPEPWHPLDYTVSYNRATIFTVFGHPFSIGQRRTFYDRSGLPLFDLRCRWYSSSVLDLKLPGAEESLLTAKLRVAVSEPRVTVSFCNAVAATSLDSSSSDTRKDKSKSSDSTHANTKPNPGPPPQQITIEVHAQDLDNMAQVVVVENRTIAAIQRITDPGQLTEGQMPPFRLRPKWEVRVAQGVDVSLVCLFFYLWLWVFLVLGGLMMVDCGRGGDSGAECGEYCVSWSGDGCLMDFFQVRPGLSCLGVLKVYRWTMRCIL